MSNTRIYLVYNDDQQILVRANSRAQAIGHVARSLFSMRVATQHDLVRLLQEKQVIDAKQGNLSYAATRKALGVDGEMSGDATK